MVAVLGGLGAALAWAVTTLCYSRSSRMLAPASVLGLVMLVGLVITAPAAVVEGVPESLDREAIGLLALAGIGNVVGLLLVVTALGLGKVGVVAPIVSTEGAIAALIAVAAGESVSAGAGVMLALIVVGIVLASRERGNLSAAIEHSGRAALLAITAALAFGTSLYATGRVSEDLPVIWVLLPTRVIGVALVTIPLLVARRLQSKREVLPFVVLAGIAEVAGFAFFALGAREGIAISAVLASQFGVIAAIAAFVLFRERLTRVQTAGITAIALGVAALSWIQA